MAAQKLLSHMIALREELDLGKQKYSLVYYFSVGN